MRIAFAADHAGAAFKDELMARLERAGLGHTYADHDDMNVLTLGARVIGPEPAFECAVAFLAATFSAEERHRRRLAKVLAIEAT